MRAIANFFGVRQFIAAFWSDFAAASGSLPKRKCLALAPRANVKSGDESPHSKIKSGMTLIELLVVVTIILVVAAATIPRLRPEIDRTRIREAARSIQLYISSARNQAIATGRSCGVMIEKLPGENGASMNLSQVETPVTYGGDETGATATASKAGAPSGGIATCKIKLSSAASIPLHQGDLIQVGYQGYWMIVTADAAAGATSLSASLDVSHGETPAWTVQNVTGPYKIIRWPTKSDAGALQLPSPAAIDLTWSGNDPVGGDQQVWPTNGAPILIVFAPDGRVDWISTAANSGIQVTTPVYLLVGRREKVKPATAAEANLNDLNSLWVSINSATGRIVVADLNSAGTTAADLDKSRTYARNSDANGGK